MGKPTEHVYDDFFTIKHPENENHYVTVRATICSVDYDATFDSPGFTRTHLFDWEIDYCADENDNEIPTDWVTNEMVFIATDCDTTSLILC